MQLLRSHILILKEAEGNHNFKENAGAVIKIAYLLKVISSLKEN